MIRKLNKNHSKQIINICNLTLEKEGFTEELFNEWFKTIGHCYGYLISDKIAGFVYYLLYEKYAYVMCISVHPDYQKYGIGNFLLKHVIFQVKREIIAKINKNNISGYKNVNWDNKSKKWRVRIIGDKNRINLGLFEDLELAGLAAEEARNKFHKEFAKHF